MPNCAFTADVYKRQQHGQDFVSVYKHCGSLLKKEGDPVKGGEALSLIHISLSRVYTPYGTFAVMGNHDYGYCYSEVVEDVYKRQGYAS